MPSINPKLQRRILKARELLSEAEVARVAALMDLAVEERDVLRMICRRLESALQ